MATISVDEQKLADLLNTTKTRPSERKILIDAARIAEANGELEEARDLFQKGAAATDSIDKKNLYKAKVEELTAKIAAKSETPDKPKKTK